MNQNSNKLFKKAYAWRYRHLSEYNFTLILSLIVGIASGLAAVALKTLVHTTNNWLLSIDYHITNGGNALLIIYPGIGILLTTLFVKYIVKGNIGHGIPEVLRALSREKGSLPPRNMWSSLVASTITVAFGGSVGLEAPIASTGSAIGSNIGKTFHLKPQNIKLLLGCGAAGAIAGIFKAPVAGMLFVVEVLMLDFTKTSALPLLISSLSASTVAYFLMGTDVQFAFHVTSDFELNQIPFYLILGIFCALTSIYFLRMTDKVERFFKHRKNQWSKILIGAITLGVLVYFFPPLFGEGYSSLMKLMEGHGSMIVENTPFAYAADSAWNGLIVLLLLILLKAISTATTIGSGGVGGTFGPSLVVGGLSGYFIALLCNQLGLPPQSTANFALVGMAAVMTGVMHAPLMSTFLIAEITGGYDLLIPLLITASVSYLVVNPFEKHSIYARNLAQKGDLLTHDKDSSAWQLINMRKLIETNFVVVRQGDKLRDLVEAIQNSRRNVFPVLSEDDKFIGAIHLDDVRRVMFCPEKYDIYSVEELMHPISEGDIVRLSDTPYSVVEKFQMNNRYNLIVIDDDGTYVGILSRANTFSAYRKFIAQESAE